MALDFTNTAGALFNRLGRIGKLADVADLSQDDLVTYFDELMAEYDSSVASPLQIVTNGTPAKRDAAASAAGSFMNSLVVEASATVQKMVLADTPAAASSILSSLREISRQMLVQGKTLQRVVVSSTATADGDNAGDGVLVVTTKRGDGLVNELVFDETATVTCTADAQVGSATAGQEGFVYVGEPVDQSPWSVTYPTGPGFSANLIVNDATVDAVSGQASGNMLVNSDFEDFTTNVPDYWDTIVGTAGVDFLLSTDSYTGTNCLQIVGGTTDTQLAQRFNDEEGTEANLLPSRSYAVSAWMKMDANPSTGVLSVELVDENNTVTTDDQGVSNAFTVDLTTLGTSYVNVSGVFRTPRDIPSVYKISIRVSTDIQASRNLFVDHMALAPIQALYTGGPGVALFSGAVAFVIGDKFALVSTNDYGGATRLATFHWLLERLFGIRAQGILFPSSDTPDVLDSLITA